MPEGIVPTLVSVREPGGLEVVVPVKEFVDRTRRDGKVYEYRRLCLAPGRGRRLPAGLMQLAGLCAEVEIVEQLLRVRRVLPPPPPQFRPGATCAERLLAYLAHAGGCLPWAVSDLTRALGCQPSTLKAAKKALEERGLIYETPDMRACLRARY
jgi:hypothetical protein